MVEEEEEEKEIPWKKKKYPPPRISPRHWVFWGGPQPPPAQGSTRVANEGASWGLLSHRVSATWSWISRVLGSFAGLRGLTWAYVGLLRLRLRVTATWGWIARVLGFFPERG